uniref:Uncharacterized protein n=1 Tax=Mycena chlorophos TaxID=658473 RepID=A0ABQ0KUQ8_MYCCL|nr:predicted protein [Mycena chlorophos]
MDNHHHGEANTEILRLRARIRDLTRRVKYTHQAAEAAFAEYRVAEADYQAAREQLRGTQLELAALWDEAAFYDFASGAILRPQSPQAAADQTTG